MNKNQKLELTWIGKDKQPKLEPRILIEDPERSYHPLPPPYQGGDKRGGGNMLIFGDNLLALKALEQDFAGKVKCIFIDPPYNTGSAFTHYDDGLEHSLWLTLMRDRLEILRRLLADDGSLWITIDDNEAHYLKVLCDEVFGRGNFVANVVWQKAYTSNQTAMHLSNTHDHVLVYAKSAGTFQIGKVPRTEEQKKTFSNPDNDPRGDWKAENLSAGKFYAAGQFPITGPKGHQFLPPKGRYWRCNERQYETWLRDGRITFGRSGEGRPMLKKFLAEMQDGLTANTWWSHEEVGSNKEASIDLKRMFGDREDVFQNPKPEKLIQRVLTLATNPGDLVLDSFGGSGTTGAVAHKMRRRWIMVELGEHCHTHIIPRMQKVCDGTDQGGISKAVNWLGGGGFKYYYMAPSLLKKDRYDQWVINEEYNANMLAAAMAKHENFRYCPDEVYYWKQGKSSEKDYIFVTTVHLTPEHLDKIHEEMQPEESLLICCKSHFKGADGKYDNISVKKIPSMLLGKCEFGRDDYSLNIVDMPREAEETEFVPLTLPKKEVKKAKTEKNKQLNIFHTDNFG